MRIPRLIGALASIALFATRPAHADRSSLVPEVGYNYGEIETARIAAMGGATRALGSGVSGLYQNPANVALTRVYHLQALAQIWPQAHRQSYGAAAVDSATSRLSAGIAGQYSVLDPDGVDRRWTDVRLALAYPISDRLYVGLTGKYLKLRQSGFAPVGFGLPPPSLASAGLAESPIVDALSFDAGITAKPTDALFIGVVGSNLTNPGNGFQPIMLGGGIGYGTNDITVEADVAADFTTFTNADGTTRSNLRAMAGLEYLAADRYPLRLGYRYDKNQSTHALSGGLGYIDPTFSVDVAVRQTVSSNDPFGPTTTIVIDLQYFIESLTMKPE